MKKGKIKEIARKIISSSMAFVLVLLIGSNSVLAYTVRTSGITDFNTKKTSFKNAKNPMYRSKSQTISGNISKSFEQDIFHYECQEGGYYAIFSTGSLDTVGCMYEEQGLFSKSYKYTNKNDDSFSSLNRNFYFVADLDKNEDYYVCVRGFGSKTGKYSLKIEPNEDKIFHCRYGVWNCEHMPDSASITKVWVDKKVYLTKEQAILYYWSLDPATVITNGKKNYNISQLQQLYKSNSTTAVNFCITALSTAIGASCGSTSVGIGASLLGFVLSEGIAASKVSKTKSDIKKTLVDLCGVKHIANAKTFKGSWTSSRGLCATKWFIGTSFPSYSWEYDSVGSTEQIKGVKWYVGKWTF